MSQNLPYMRSKMVLAAHNHCANERSQQNNLSVVHSQQQL